MPEGLSEDFDFDLDEPSTPENANFARLRRYAKNQERLAKEQAQELAALREQMGASRATARESIKTRFNLGDEEWADLQALAPDADPAALERLATRMSQAKPEGLAKPEEQPPTAPPISTRQDAVFSTQTGEIDMGSSDDEISYERYREMVVDPEEHQKAIRLRLEGKVKPPSRHLDAEGNDKYRGLYPRPQDPGYNAAGGWKVKG